MSARDHLSDHAKEQAKNISIRFFEDKEKYSKRQYAHIYKGYDFLEDLFSVRTYIQKRYDIDLATLELLLKLMGMKVFTRLDFSSLPKDYGIHRLRHFRKLGYLSVLSEAPSVEDTLFTLSPKGKTICVKFYKYLSGESKIPEDGANNPMANRNKQVKFDKKKMDMIKRMNELPIKEHNKTLF